MLNIGLGDLSVKIKADTSNVKKGLKETSRGLKATTKELNANSKHWHSWSRAAVAANAALAIAMGLSARKALEYSDSFRSMSNKLRLVTSSTEELADVTSRMFDIARETRSSVEATTTLYTRLHRSTRNLEISDERLLKVTESINKAFAISGATGAESAGAIRQLSQALAAGALRGEEFNSVSEQAPIIMEAVKQATGETAGSLRKLAETGAITSEVMIESLERYAEKIDGDFGTAIKTFAQKLENAKTNAIEFVGGADAINESVNDAGDAILYLSKNIGTLIDVGKIAAAIYGATLVGSVVRFTAAQIASTAATTSSAASVNLWTGAATRMSTAAIIATRASVGLRAAMAALGGPVGILISVAASLALFVDWETDSEKQTRKTTGEIDEQVASLKNLTAAQRDAKMREWIEQQNELTEAIKKQQIVAENAKKANDKAPTVGSAVVMAREAEALDALIAKRLAFQKLGNEMFDIKVQETIGSGEDSAGGDEKIDLRAAAAAEAKRKANQKIVASLMRRLESEEEAENNRFAREIEAIKSVTSQKLALAAKEGADIAGIKAEEKALIEKLEQEHVNNLSEIRADESRGLDSDFLSDLADRFKSEEQLEIDRYATERNRFIAAVGGKEELTSAHLQTLRDMEQEHQDAISEIKNGEGFLLELEERFASEAELETMMYEAELVRLQEHLAKKGELTASDNELKRKLTEAHEKALTDIKRREERAKIQIMTSAMGAMVSTLSSGGKKAQAIGKKIAIARAVLAGGQAAVDAWRSGMETPGPWAPLVAAAYTADSIRRTASLISSIKGNSKPAAGGGGSRPSVPSGSPAGAGQGSSDQGGPSKVFNVHIEGNGPVPFDQVRDLMGLFNEHSENGFNLVGES